MPNEWSATGVGRSNGRSAFTSTVNVHTILSQGTLSRVPVDYDAELRVHNARLRRVYDIGPDDRVLDIGCGTGQTTRDAAHTAVVGSVLGVDTSAPAIERARRLAYGEGLHNVTHAVADAQVHSFDMRISTSR